MTDIVSTLNDFDSLLRFMDDTQKQLTEAIHSRATVEKSTYELKLEIIILQGKIKELQAKKIPLDEALSKSKETCAVLGLMYRRAKEKYWTIKNG